MKLSEQAIAEVSKNRKLINLIAIKRDSHSGTVERWLRENKDDGELTKISTIELISQETGLDNKQILSENDTAKH